MGYLCSKPHLFLCQSYTSLLNFEGHKYFIKLQINALVVPIALFLQAKNRISVFVHKPIILIFFKEPYAPTLIQDQTSLGSSKLLIKSD